MNTVSMNTWDPAGDLQWTVGIFQETLGIKEKEFLYDMAYFSHAFLSSIINTLCPYLKDWCFLVVVNLVVCIWSKL